MKNDAPFLGDLPKRAPRFERPIPFEIDGLHVGQGALGLEALVLHSARAPAATELRSVWKQRLGGRAVPLVVVVLGPRGASICGPAGEEPPVYEAIDPGQAERMCREALALPDRHAALRYLAQTLPSLESRLPGLRNEGLLANHELQVGVRQRHDWSSARGKAASVLGKQGEDFLLALGFSLERHDGLTSFLKSRDRKSALAVLLNQSESPETGSPRFSGISPITYALAIADRENLPYVVVVQDSRIRLYPTDVGKGVGRRARTETYVECHTSLLRDDDAGYLWLLFSSDALARGGTFEQILEESGRFAGNLADRLRERIYQKVVPDLASAVAQSRALKRPTVDQLSLTYEITLTILFRLLFIAYAEDRDLLPYKFNEAYRRRSLKQKALELKETAAPATGDSHWREIRALFEAVDVGNTEWGVPPYDGGLFASDKEVSKAGAEIVNLTLPNELLLPVLKNLLLIENVGEGPGPVDFRSLGVREFGTIYEGLLESELSVAEVELTVDADGTYLPRRKSTQPVVVRKGQIYLHDRSGSRKATGSYFTRAFVVDHLLDQALEPALADHIARLDALNDADAAEAIFDFRVADIAMGSAHFLVAAIDRIERSISGYLARRPLSAVARELMLLREAAVTALGSLADQVVVEDGELLRRLIARRCTYGVDQNPFSVQLAKLAVWVHTFVPGLPLSLLDHNLIRGNSLVGVGTIGEVRTVFELHGGGLFPIDTAALLGAAAQPLLRLGKLLDVTKRDIAAGRQALEQAREAVAATDALFDIIAAQRVVGPEKLRFQYADWERSKTLVAQSKARRLAREVLTGLDAFHFPSAFPEVFLRKRAGFDVVVGNPPWEKVRVEEHEFWARHFPGLRGLKTDAREAELTRLRRLRPDLGPQWERERVLTERLRDAVRDLPGMNTGHPDLFRAFLYRFISLVTEGGGRVGVVLPGDAFKIRGALALRKLLDEQCDLLDVQMLTNKGEWVFKDVHQQKPIALITARRNNRREECSYMLRAECHDPVTWSRRRKDEFVTKPGTWIRQFSEGLVLPTVVATGSFQIIEKYLAHPRLEGHPELEVRRVYADFETTRDRALYHLEGNANRWPVYKGESFDLWNPDTKSYFAWANGKEITQRAQERRLRAPKGSPYATFPNAWREDPATHPALFPRIAFRDVTNRTNQRTLVVALIPPQVITTQTAPWVLWLNPERPPWHEAYLLGLMSTRIVDWWVRRFVEGHVDEEAFNSIRIPVLGGKTKLARRMASVAGRLAAVDRRYAKWARVLSVEVGPLDASERERSIYELEALTAVMYDLEQGDLEHIYETFHDTWDQADFSAAVIDRYRKLSGDLR